MTNWSRPVTRKTSKTHTLMICQKTARHQKPALRFFDFLTISLTSLLLQKCPDSMWRSSILTKSGEIAGFSYKLDRQPMFFRDQPMFFRDQPMFFPGQPILVRGRPMSFRDWPSSRRSGPVGHGCRAVSWEGPPASRRARPLPKTNRTFARTWSAVTRHRFSKRRHVGALQRFPEP